jgi:hypothetical protein
MDGLNRKHEVLAVRLWDPREMDLPDVGVVLVEDLETGDQLSVDTSDRGFRRRFHEAARLREAELAQTFRRAVVDELRLSTQEDLVLALPVTQEEVGDFVRRMRISGRLSRRRGEMCGRPCTSSL